MRPGLFVIAAGLLVGCSGGGGTPTIDASSDEALDASIRRIKSTLSEEGRKEFAADCATVSGPEMMKSVYRKAYDQGERKASSHSALFRSLNGLTAPQIHAKALEMRTAIDVEKAKAKSDNDRMQAQAKSKYEQEQAEFRKAEEAEKLRRAKANAELAALKAPELIVKKAADEMKKYATTNFGSDAVSRAEITADPSGVKTTGESWEVTGLFIGPDKNGVVFQAKWVARIQFLFGTLQCTGLQLGARQSAGTALAAGPGSAGAGGAKEAGPAGARSPSKGMNKSRSKPMSVAQRAANALKFGQSKEDAGRSDEALGIYRDLVKSYPGTQESEKAQDRIDVLTGKPRKK